MSLGLKSSGKIDAWVTAMKRMNMYDMGDAETRRVVLFSIVYGTPSESQVTPHIREYMMRDELTPIAMLRPTDALRKVLGIVDEEAEGIFMTAISRYSDTARSLGVTNVSMYAVMQALPMMRDRFRTLRFEIKDSYADIRAVTPAAGVGASTSSDAVMGMYIPQSNVLYLFQQSLGRMSAIADQFVFTLLHELAHVIDPCMEEQTAASSSKARLSADMLNVIGHCTRYRYVLLELCNSAGLIRREIYRAAQAALARDTTFSGITYTEVDAWESSFTNIPPLSSEFKLRSEVVSIPRARFIQGLARRNYADAAVVELDSVVAVDGVYNLFDTDPAEYPLDILTTYSAEGIVSEGPVTISGSEYGLYMQFLTEPGAFVYTYTTPQGEIFTLNFAEAYWMLT